MELQQLDVFVDDVLRFSAQLVSFEQIVDLDYIGQLVS